MTQIANVFIGNEQADRVYLGSDLVWERETEVASNIPNDYILAYDFNGNYLDKSASNLHGIESGNVSFVAGRKEGTQAVAFNGGLVQTPNILPINNNVVSISFWMKVLSGNGYIMHMNSEIQGNDNFYLYANSTDSPNYIALGSYFSFPQGLYRTESTTPDETWFHVFLSINRNPYVIDYHEVYINNTKNITITASTRASGNFLDAILYIGKQLGGSTNAVTYMQDLRIYNKYMSATERTELYNE